MLLEPPLPADFESSVRECCAAANKCCEDVLQKDVQVEGTCPGHVGRLELLPRANAGVVHHFCPAYIFGNRWRRIADDGAVKKCREDGRWEEVVLNGVLQERTDYVGCHQKEPWLIPLLMSTFIAYCISAATIVPALLLLSCNRRIKNLSIFFIHRQLLLCLLLDACCYILNTLLFMPTFQWHGTLFFENHFVCRLLFVIQYGYFKLASFAWMLAEALHLRWLLFSSPSNHIESANRMLLCTWGGPAIIAIIYGFLIEEYERDTCMPESSNLFIRALITIPCTVCLLINTIILCVTVRLIVQKLRTNQMNSSVRNYRKVMHALLVLIPLFGVNLASAIWSTESDAHDYPELLRQWIRGLPRVDRRVLGQSDGNSSDRLLDQEHAPTALV
ncbi:hypothetical protein M3Y99_01842400 [Aphelenchoides fujianensis]|nr:hypothetical protein M3Y99_01842400 [Aphelenchoides fujianensis]